MHRTTEPTVSVLMTAFNTPFHLAKRAIDSVLRQDNQSFELLVLDDGSHPDLSFPLEEYCQLYQTKIRYIRHSNCGQSQSINRGVLVSRGTYITVIDSDDEYKPNHLSACLNEMRYADLISSFTDTIVTNADDHYVPDKYDNRKTIHVDDCTLFATLFGKREVFETLAFKNMYSADSEFYTQASLRYPTKKANLRTYIYYRNNAHSITASLKKEQCVNP